MHGNDLIFSRSGDSRRLYRVSPLLFPQYTTFNRFFLPDEHELPAHGLESNFLVFDFGFSDPNLVIAPYDTGYFPVELGFNFLAEVITGVSDVLGVATVPATGSLQNAQVSPAYLINFQHTHLGNTRQWAAKNVPNGVAVGTAENPLLFKSPVLIPKGDSLVCIVQNLANAQLRVQVLLTGGSFD
jgi:hypothetical protein